jgi:hypothetical protein
MEKYSNHSDKNHSDSRPSKDSFLKMVDEQMNKYEGNHEPAFFCGKEYPYINYDPSYPEVPGKDSSYDFCKEPSQSDKPKNKLSEGSDVGNFSSSEQGTLRQGNESDNSQFINLGRFNSVDSSKKSTNRKPSPQQLNKSTQSENTNLKKEARPVSVERMELDYVPTKQYGSIERTNAINDEDVLIYNYLNTNDRPIPRSRPLNRTLDDSPLQSLQTVSIQTCFTSQQTEETASLTPSSRTKDTCRR